MAKAYVELFISDKLVDTAPDIFMTYSLEDLRNPTIVKNSFSKTVAIGGTPRNNQIFGTFFDMQREVVNGSSYTGANFNPTKKVPFSLYLNGERIEHGYCKLDSVKRVGNNITYCVTLYGGLGQFLHNLSYRDETEKIRLSDLDFGGGDKEFDLKIDKSVINKAWKHINGISTTDSLYDKINFAPCYNGIPENFSADKVAIDVRSFWNADDFALSDQFNVDRSTGKINKDGYTDVDGWVIGELEKDYNELQMLDMRSYLQRPVIRFKEVIKACCNPVNNGGYTVDLDPDFFNANNPYYEDAWMTLPLLTEIEEEADDEIYMSGDKLVIPTQDVGTNFSITTEFNIKAETDAVYDELATGCFVMYQGNIKPQIQYNCARYVQLVIYDKNNKAVGGSEIKSFFTSIKNGQSFTYSPVYQTNVTEVIGTFKKVSGKDEYMFNGHTHELTTQPIPYETGMYAKLIVKKAEYTTTSHSYDDMLFTNNGINSVSVEAETSCGVIKSELKSLKGLGWLITKKTLLSCEGSPADFFLSYLKMFNMHIWQSDDDKIMVRLRKNYFTGEQYDLEDLVDRGSEITITPLNFDAKWYNFTNEYAETGLLKDYQDEYGLDYGIQKVDTNYNFDNSSKNLFEGNVFKGTIMSRGKSRYYTHVNVYHTGDMSEDIDYPPFMIDGVKTFVFNASGDTKENAVITPKSTDTSTNWWNEKYYDFAPRPVFTDSKDEAVDGANVLLFYNGKVAVEDAKGSWIQLNITDDIAQFAQLNNGEPCWLWSYSTSIGIRPEYLPVFGRYKTNENGWVTHSWDFGTPKALYVPDYQIDDSSNIYTQYWQTYIRDRYNVNTRVAECKVLLGDKVIGEWLRRFYYWDGCWWAINKITDYNAATHETTKCQMVKINDPQNYK